jgi:hypothetical protein
LRSSDVTALRRFGKRASERHDKDAIQHAARSTDVLTKNLADLLEGRRWCVEIQRLETLRQSAEATLKTDAQVAITCQSIQLGQVVGILDNARNHVCEKRAQHARCIELLRGSLSECRGCACNGKLVIKASRLFDAGLTSDSWPTRCYI